MRSVGRRHRVSKLTRVNLPPGATEQVSVVWVHMRSARLAVIMFRRKLLVWNVDTLAVLPDTTVFALYHQTK